VPSTRQFDFGSGPDLDQAYQWNTKPKLFSLVVVCAPPNAVLVCFVFHETNGRVKCDSKYSGIYFLGSCLKKSFRK